MDPNTHSIDIIELVNKATDLVNDAQGCAHGQIEVQKIVVGKFLYSLSVVIEVEKEYGE
jgi:hypothetical protein